ncbi:muconate cycloisomerase [Acinetobacter pittii]|uniref:Muconate cycloisomerase n=2 Tax=Acinetobacter calcoaceticus/baumannii complex TaxID=909768 RepID=A0A1C2RR79_ACIPI|nr:MULTISPECIES: muconate/chloromuconate family cycloisomerase [Acinetobacter calcoaceticus/baumannii complex]HCA5722145.1 muconate cycloisomerase [Acinetobacter baumannii]AQV16713.1 muconate cycloisomerase [Acinetobacter pittii]AUT34211.1 muconate cycloisomerase [Acinetobacter pittii]AVN18163.1 muconate cycloisomerase [Acinetobacter pittii]AZB94736.1 muconate cycloisomerase [Acinetobacter pittii]
MYRTIETILVDIPTIRPHQLSVTTMRTQTLVLVKITTTDGIVGWGEATTIGGLNYGEESPESVKANIDTYFAPLLASVKDLNVAQTLKLIRKNINGNRFAKCAIQTALLDIQAKRLGVPLSEVLGGRLRNSLPVLWTLASGDTEKDIAEARKMIELKRHNTFKLKIGSRPLQHDVDHVIAIKKALGADISVRVDVNRAWSELECIQGIQQLQDGGIDLIEQPCAIQNTEALARLTQRFDVAIMADEALTGPDSAYRIAKSHGADVFAVKIEQSGGLIEACEVAKVAGLAGIDLYGGTMLEGPVGSMASAHAFATFETLAFGTELFGPLLLTEEILKEPLRYENFELHLPTAPGLGIEIDEDKVEKLRR